jgi:biopolymer transport protein ExbD
MPIAAVRTDHAPLVDLNITPLIDVMLVLLVMFILCLPIATHQVPVDLPRNSGVQAAPPHRLAIAAGGALSWDGAPVSDTALRERLAAAAAAGEALTLAPDAQARYARVDALLADIRRAGVTRLGFEGNERWRAF